MGDHEIAPGTLLWSPPSERPAESATIVGRYVRWLSETDGLQFDDYDALWAWSVTEYERFWGSLAEFFAVRWHQRPTTVLAQRAMPGTGWFAGGTLNYAEHALARSGSDVALVSASQTRATQTYTWDELREQVAAVRAGLVRLGVARGDRVAAYMPNIAETVIALLATASLGAIWASCAPEFGTRSVIDRLAQIEPKVLLVVDGYRFGDRRFDRTTEVTAIRAALPTVEHCVMLPYLDADRTPPSGVRSWSELTATTGELVFDPVPFDHPIYVLYSSGTTGLPKPIVHGHGGMLVEHLKWLMLHADVGPDDTFFQNSSTGWMAWNFSVSALAAGAALVVYDGDPTWPDLGTLWQVVADHGVTHFGIATTFLINCRKQGLVPKEVADLSRLRGLTSGGAPLPASCFAWIYEAVGSQLMLASASGGTDVCSAFVGMNPLVPVYAGEISRPFLGAKVEAFDDDGRPIIDRQGELVLTVPMPCMPVCFWNDVDGSRYHAAYFERFPGVWCHGDWITFTQRGTCVITGRSDATLNRGGVRLGTSEFYAVVEELDAVADSLVVHLEDEEGGMGELLLLIVPVAGTRVDDALRAEIVTALRTNLSPRHVPNEIIEVPAIARNLTGKKMEVPVKRLLSGTLPDVAAGFASLAEPVALDALRQLQRTRVGARDDGM